MGKWSRFKGKLQTFKPETPYQGKVEEVKRHHAGVDQVKLGQTLRDFKELKRQLEAKVYDVNVAIEACSQLLNDWLDANQTESFKLEGVGTISLQVSPYAQVTDERQLLKWIQKKKLNNLLRFPWQTLNAMVKDMLEEGKPLPPGVDVFLKSKIVIYGGKKNEDEANPEE